MPGIRPFCSGAEMYFQIFQWGHPGLQAFWVNDAQATPLATYAETGQVAMIERKAIVTTYYPNKHYGLRRWLATEDLDGTVAVPEYGHWRRPGQTGEIATLPGSLRLHHKYFLSEPD